MSDLPIWPPYISEVETEGYAQLVPAITGASMVGRVAVFDVPLSGASVSIPTGVFSDCFALGVHVRVLEDIVGPTAIQVGIAGSTTLFSSGSHVLPSLAAGASTWMPPYSPVDFFWGGDLPVIITADGGDFTAGKIRLGAYSLCLTPPSA
ncbi:hypothetical protein [Xanthobacter aminoxidans]|uniref:hypothetical protein n=1 Tax=Xanthobacter aminoxidans TaxID=186280 RepID=UPI00202311EF|nr:hypothetical protein [Xanthobacter aminoxidans]MCL8384168.1 hypothetical protein [Xanthobacter aminoxidans]